MRASLKSLRIAYCLTLCGCVGKCDGSTVDTDQDGLSDKLELLYGNDGQSDSDEALVFFLNMAF